MNQAFTVAQVLNRRVVRWGSDHVLAMDLGILTLTTCLRRGCYFMAGCETRDKETPGTVNTVPQAGSANRDWTQAAWLQAHSSKNWKWMCFLQENGHRMWENLLKKCVAWERSSARLLFLLSSVWGSVGLKITLRVNGKVYCVIIMKNSL